MNASTASKRETIGFAGAGNMAEAIIAGLVGKKICEPGDVLACDVLEERRKHLAERYGVRVTSELGELPEFGSTILLAVKPKHLAEAGEALAGKLNGGHLIISILAGQSLARLGSALGGEPNLVRVMPNLCARVGAGVSAITFPSGLPEDRREWTRQILSAVGDVVEVPEDLQDAVTAVSGSGPGYIFDLAGHFMKAAEAVGLDPATARKLVVETLYGSARVLQDTDETCEELVRKVATPGGTTEAGLSALADGDAAGILREVVQRATDRSKELGKA